MRATTLVATVLVTACASGGGAPAMTPDEANVLYARYSGEWVLNEQLSDPGSAALETEARARRGDALGDRPETTSTAIRPTYRRAGEARDAVAGRMDRLSMRQTILMAGKRPETLGLQLSADGLRVRYDDGPTVLLPADGSRIEVREDLMPTRVRLVWENRLPIIEREVENGGTVREILETAPNGTTLWLTRQVVMAREGWAPAQFTFGR